MFQDEARFGRINEPRRCWAPGLVRPEALYQTVREYTFTYAAVSPHDGVLDSLILPVVDSEAMLLFLKEVSSRHSEEFVMMILDKAGWHIAKEVAVPENMRLVFLPAYSPQLNPVEHLWDEIKEKWFTNKVFQSLEAVEDLLADALAALENDEKRIHSLTGFDWINSINLKAT